jgi:hypothetical protein
MGNAKKLLEADNKNIFEVSDDSLEMVSGGFSKPVIRHDENDPFQVAIGSPSIHGKGLKNGG